MHPLSALSLPIYHTNSHVMLYMYTPTFRHLSYVCERVRTYVLIPERTVHAVPRGHPHRPPRSRPCACHYPTVRIDSDRPR